MKTIREFFKFIIRLLVVWFIDTISLIVTAWIVSGIDLYATENASIFVVATAAAFILGIVNFLVRPLILLIAMPLGWMVMFLAGFLINGVVIYIAASLMPGFDVSSLWMAFLAGLLFSLINTLLTTLMSIDDEDSFYENLVQRQALRFAGAMEKGEGRGLVILETDGLSFQRIQLAIQEGYMPTLKQMIEEDGYQLSRVDCGIPPTTPACQAGILQGNNTNIPAFRWLDKSTGKLLAGGQAAAIVEPELSDGNGLLRGGSSIGNMFSGDAAKSILTFSKIKAGTPEDKKQRARDMYLLMRNPYFFMRVLILFFGDVILEIWQGWQQRRKDVQPRLNRLHMGYPFLRAAVNVFLRDIGTYFTILDVIRGAPAIYTLYAGYDEIAHHSGPYTNDTSISLRQFDKQVARIKKVIEEKASRPYELLILSDHGQSFGPTFKQRYGMGILDFIQQNLPGHVTAVATGGGDDGTIGVSAMMDELQNIQEQKQGGRVATAVFNSTQRTVERSLAQQTSFQEVKPAKVTLCYGGNGALVYFDLFPRKIKLTELNEAYPGMVDALVQHEGIGFVIAYDEDYEAIAYGKNGARNLHTGDVVGEDPLAPFGDVELRSWQLRRMANFDNCGDLILNSTLYPDGTVAALEELIGNHGGLGGEQTDAYLFHPGDLQVPQTRSAEDIMHLLDSRRGLPGYPPKPERPAVPQVNPWAPSVVGKGFSQVGKWLQYVVRAIILDGHAYREIAQDKYMTGVAVFIAFIGAMLQSYFSTEGFDFIAVLLRLGVWLLSMIFIQLAARFLRGKGTPDSTLRVTGFAQSAYLFELLAIIPVFAPLARPLAVILSFFGVWIGAANAHELKGWRSLVLPILYLAIVIISFVFLIAVVKGTSFALQSILADIGLAPSP